MTKRVRVEKEIFTLRPGCTFSVSGPEDKIVVELAIGFECFPHKDEVSIKDLIEKGFLSWVEEPREMCMCNHSTKPGSIIMVEDPKQEPLVCAKCHKELPFHIYRKKKEQTLADKFWEYEQKSRCNMRDECNNLAQIATTHFKELFNKIIKKGEYEHYAPIIVHDLRKALFWKEK